MTIWYLSLYGGPITPKGRLHELTYPELGNLQSITSETGPHQKGEEVPFNMLIALLALIK